MPKRILKPQISEPASPRALRQYMPLLLVLFVGSGCAALIYEVVWFQLLQLAIGSSAISLGVLLGTYMGGMCLGSLALPRFISIREHPLRVYALLEAGIGVFGLLVFFGVPFLDRIYGAIAGYGLWSIVLRAILAAICLLPPTLLMGASLPAIARWIETTRRGVSWLGFFYGANIAGAVFGCLLAGFYLLRIYDMGVATYVAVSINIGVALISYGLARKAPYEAPAVAVDQEPQAKTERVVYLAIALSGMCALGAEVIWTRLLSLMMGATVYTFSIILAVFLVGLGLGSGAGSFLSRQVGRPRAALGVCQILLAAAIAWTAYTLANSVPNWPINPLLSKSPWFNFEVDLMRVLWSIFPATVLWGASFPLALAAVATGSQDPGRLVGEVYAANTIGAILGAVGFSIVFIPLMGTQNSQRLLIGLSALAAVIVLTSSTSKLSVAAAALTAGFLMWSVSEVPWLAVAYGRRMAIQTDPGRLLYLGEGMNSSVAISELPDGKTHYFHVSGKVEASTEPYDMRLQRMLGHLSALVHKQPRSVLVVGFGAGVTAGSFTVHPGIERIVICEIERLIPPAATQFFSRENYNVLHDPRTEMVYDDARHFILTTKEKFDIITSDPIHPWVKGTSALYSKEYFELCKRHLNPGGVVSQWVPLYESDEPTVKSELATFFDVFPGGTIWGNDIDGSGYDTVLLGQAEPTRIDLDELQARLDRPEYASVLRSLRATNFGSGTDLLGTYAGRAQDLAPWLEHAEINQDLNLRLQYLAGMGLNFDKPVLVYNDILRYLKFPEDMFTGSPARREALRGALMSVAARH